jgi:ABC-2 type transport system ATP-binding protein
VIHDPPLLVLDEPAAGLDPKARVELKVLLKELHGRGKTIFITSHILVDLEEICTSVAFIERGRLLRVGRLQDVMQEGRSVRRFRIKLAAAGFALAEWLEARQGVSSAAAEAVGAQFAFAGTDSDLATIVRELVAAGAPVCGVEELTETLERLYSRVSSGEVM